MKMGPARLQYWEGRGFRFRVRENAVAWIQWGENPGEDMMVVKNTLQQHENQLNGHEGQEGVVPTVATLMTQIRMSKNIGLVLNTLLILTLMYMQWRDTIRPPTIIYQYPPTTQNGAPPQKKSYAEPGAVTGYKPEPPQDSGINGSGYAPQPQ